MSPARPTDLRRSGWTAAGGAAAAATLYVAAVDPEQPGHYPVCPFHTMTGLWCPACGSLRAVHALSHGDLTTALHRNALLVAMLPLALVFGIARPRLTPTALWTLLTLVIAFGVARNLPPTDWLAP